MVGMILTSCFIPMVGMILTSCFMVGMILTSCFKYTYGWYDIN